MRIFLLLLCVFFSVFLYAAQPPFIPVPVVPLASEVLPAGVTISPEGGGTIYRCLFDRTFDVTGDLWPDGWVRKTGIEGEIGYPNYVPVEIAEVDSPVSSFALNVALSGGAAGVFSPRIPVRPGMSYAASVLTRTENIVHNVLFMTLSFYDEDAVAPLSTYTSPIIASASRWTVLEIPPIVASDPRVSFATLGLFVIPHPRQDYSGNVYFTDVILHERPHVILTTGVEEVNPSQLFFSPRDIDVQCKINGISQQLRTVTLTLEDHWGRRISSRDLELDISPMTQQGKLDGKTYVRNFSGMATWRALPLMFPGFYCVRASLMRTDDESKTGEDRERIQVAHEPLHIVVLDAAPSPVGGEFGWTLQKHSADEIMAMQTLLGQAGVSRLKIPTWLPSSATEAQWAQMRELCDWLMRRRIELIGILAPPPSEVESPLPFDRACAAAVFTQPSEVWFPTLQKMLVQLSLQCKYWQVSGDNDLSMHQIPNLDSVLFDIRQLFNTVGYDVAIGLTWDWTQPIPPTFLANPPAANFFPSPLPPPSDNPLTLDTIPAADLALDPLRQDAVRELVQLASTAPLTSKELSLALQRTRDTAVLRWATIQPLPAKDYSPQDRVNDLVDSMVAAKIHRADAAFCPTPFDNEVGLMRADTTPDFLFLPWRTTSLLLNTTRYVGSIRMPQRSRNQIFERPDKTCVMLVSNHMATLEEPINETLYLGEETEQAELWGRRVTPLQDRANQVIPVLPVPTFVTGLNRDVVQWRQTFRFAKTSIPTFIGQRNNNSFRFINDTNEGVGVQVNLVIDSSSGIKIAPTSHSFVLAPGDEVNRDFVVTISPTTSSGSHPVRADVTVEGLNVLKFAVYDDFLLGESDLSMSFLTRVNRQGALEVLQTFTNEGEQIVTYRCVLYVAGRPVERKTVVEQGTGCNDQTYTLPNGRELLGREITVRAEPIYPSPGQPLLYKFRAVAY